MPWKCFPEIGKPFPGNWQCSATKRMYISSLSQNRFWSDSKLIHIRFKTGSDLTQDWIWLPSHPSRQVWREEEALTFQTDSTLKVDAISPFLSCAQRGGGPGICRLIQHWIWMPSHPSCHVCREEEALTFPDWFNTEFCCPLMSCAEMRRLWHFQTYSSLNPLPSLKLLVANIMGANIFYKSYSHLNSPLLVFLDESISVSFSNLIEIWIY